MNYSDNGKSGLRLQKMHIVGKPKPEPDNISNDENKEISNDGTN